MLLKVWKRMSLEDSMPESFEKRKRIGQQRKMELQQ